jgi:ribosomal protein S18 acetylase RimI-like enzyme
MRVERAGYRDIRGWLDLAGEVEPLFGPMLDGPDFYHALLRQIGRGTAFCVREGNGPPGAPLLGGLLFSPPRPGRDEYRIGWLAVAARCRQQGMGRLLVEHACGLVEPPATLSVVTFGEDVAGGQPARRLYERLGFRAQEMTGPGPEGGSRQVFRRVFP